MNDLLNFSTSQFITELQSLGLQLKNGNTDIRRGGAGPSDHKAVTIDGRTVMVPILKAAENDSPFTCKPNEQGISYIRHSSGRVIPVSFPHQPRFYDLKTADGIPYSHIATLHSSDVLATTVFQSCIRYTNRKKSCQFCAIGQSLEAGRTILHKTPQQLAEVAKAAVELDGVKQMIMTTGTPNVTDRGAAILCESAKAVKAAVNLPIQGQCEPPDDDIWFERMKAAGIDSLGMHLEVVTPEIRARIMPSKAEVPLERYMSAFDSAVSVFGRGEVSTYILAGLGDTINEILFISERLIHKGVYPFVVPFVPIMGTPLENHPAPTPQFMQSIFEPLGAMLKQAGLRSSDAKAGCAKCGACSALSSYEV